MDCITIRWNEFVLLMKFISVSMNGKLLLMKDCWLIRNKITSKLYIAIVKYKNEFILRLLLFISNTHAKYFTNHWIKNNDWYDHKIEEYLVKLGY